LVNLDISGSPIYNKASLRSPTHKETEALSIDESSTKLRVGMVLRMSMGELIDAIRGAGGLVPREFVAV